MFLLFLQNIFCWLYKIEHHARSVLTLRVEIHKLFHLVCHSVIQRTEARTYSFSIKECQLLD